MFWWCRLSQAQTVAEKQQDERQEEFLKCVPRRVEPMVERQPKAGRELPEPQRRVFSPILDPVTEKLGPEGIVRLQNDAVFSKVGVALEKHYMETAPEFKLAIAAARQDITASPKEHMLAEAAKAVGPKTWKGRSGWRNLRERICNWRFRLQTNGTA